MYLWMCGGGDINSAAPSVVVAVQTSRGAVVAGAQGVEEEGDGDDGDVGMYVCVCAASRWRAAPIGERLEWTWLRPRTLEEDYGGPHTAMLPPDASKQQQQTLQEISSSISSPRPCFSSPRSYNNALCVCSLIAAWFIACLSYRVDHLRQSKYFVTQNKTRCTYVE